MSGEGWRAENDRHRTLYVEAAKERDELREQRHQLLDALGRIALALVPTDAPPGIVDFGDVTDVLGAVRAVVAERDRLAMSLEEEQEIRAEAIAERDRLRVEKAHLVEVNAALRNRPDLAERAPLVVALADERDRLRAVVEAVESYMDHLSDCAVHADYPCDCELDDVLARLIGRRGTT